MCLSSIGLLSGCSDQQQTHQIIKREIYSFDPIAGREPVEEFAERVAQLCARSGEQGVQVVLDAAQTETNPIKTLALAEALLMIDINKHLINVIEVVANDSDSRPTLVEFLKGRLDGDSREIVQDLVLSSEGNTRILSCMVLELMCDDIEYFELAKSLLEQDALSQGQVISALFLLGSAAYYNNDPSALNTTAPHNHGSSGTHDRNRSTRMPMFLRVRRVFLVCETRA
jgi:hypothetical protein